MQKWVICRANQAVEAELPSRQYAPASPADRSSESPRGGKTRVRQLEKELRRKDKIAALLVLQEKLSALRDV